MTDEEEIERVVAEAIGAAEDVGVNDGLDKYLRKKRILSTPFMHVPTELYGVMDILVPGDGDRAEDDTVRIEANEETIRAFRDAYRPDFMSIRSDVMKSPEQIAAAYTYVNGFSQYLAEQYSVAQSHYDDLSMRVRFAEDRLNIDLEEMIPKSTMRKSFIRQHPLFVRLVRERAIWDGLRKRLEIHSRVVVEKIKELSRMVKMLDQHIYLGGDLSNRNVEDHPSAAKAIQERRRRRGR